MNTHVRFMRGLVRDGLFGPSGRRGALRAWTPVRRLAVVFAIVVCGVLGLGAGSAFAVLAFPFDGQLAPAGGSFGALAPNSVAVDDSNGDTYVADSGSGVVDVFETGSGTQLAGLNGLLTPAGSFGHGQVQVAANDGSGAVYVLDSTDSVVDVFESTGAFRCLITGRKPVSLKEQEEECNGAAGSEPEGGAFNGPGGIAVDQATGEVYVVDANNGVVDVFSAGGGYLRKLSLPAGFSAQYTRGVAVDDFNGHVYVSDSGTVVVYVFNAAGGYETTWTGANTPAGSFGNGYLSVAADNANGDVFVTDTQHRVTDVLEPSGGYTGVQFSHSYGEFAQGTAVDQASGKVYVSNSAAVVDLFGPAVNVPEVVTGSAGEVGPRAATLHGTVNPDAIQLSDCHFDYVAEANYNASAQNPYSAGLSAACVPAAGTIPADSNPHAVTAAIGELQPGTTYHYRLQANNADGVPAFGQDATFATPPPPAIHGAIATNITATTVDLGAQINPEDSETTYHFEWGTSTSYNTSIPVPDGHIAAGTSDVPVGTHLSGLSANTTYHWRVVATNASGTTMGVDHTFVYDTMGAAGLPDNRAYEMVTPPQKNGALIGEVLGNGLVVGEAGSRVMASTIQCFAGAGSCPAAQASVGSAYVFSRGAGGWVASSLSPSATVQSENGNQWLFSVDAGTSLFSAPTAPFGEEDFYARRPDGSFVDVGPLSPPSGGTNLEALTHMEVRAATADLSHFVYTGDPLWPGSVGTTTASLFEYVGTGNSAPLLVGVSGGPGSTDLISSDITSLGGSLGGLSADGRTVFFIASHSSSGTGANSGTPVPVDELFARVDSGEAGAHTVAVSQPSVISPVPPNHECVTPGCVANTSDTTRFRDAGFVGASGDGSKVFFLSTQQLTDNAGEDPNTSDSATGGCSGTVGVNGCNLYLYDFGSPVGERLVGVSGAPVGGPRVQGVVALSGDGSHVYFVARGVLTGAANGAGQVARDGAENLYVFERDSAYPQGRVVFIAVLPEADNQEWTGPGEPANVTPDGRFLVFTSRGVLTADTTRTDGAQQVFRYDAQSGVLVRVSIGERGFNDNGNGGAGDASIVRANGYFGVAGVARRDPTMSHDGAFVFFMSPVALTAGALNSVPIGAREHGELEYAENVYEYHEGQVFLVSDGRDTHGSTGSSSCHFVSAVCLAGVDGTGANVFFSTVDRLVPQDTDTQLDWYDARVCTPGDPCVAGPPQPVAPCVGEGCRGVPAGAPSLPGAGSVVFSGAGNHAPAVSQPAVRPKSLGRAQMLARALRGCRSQRGRRRRVVCEARARKRYASKSKTRSTSRRGGK